MSDIDGMPAADQADVDLVVSAACAGSEGAFVVLFREIQPRLLGYLRTVCAGDAEDIAAETWVQAIGGLHNFSGGMRDFRAWIFTIARARVVDRWRAKGRRREIVSAVVPERASELDVAQEAEENFSTATAIALLRELPDAQSQVLLLRVVAGLDVQTTAAVLGRTPNHVRVLAHRGLRALAVILERRDSQKQEALLLHRSVGAR